MPPTTTLPSSSASASSSSTSQAASGTPPRKLSRGGGGAEDGMYCYLNQMAQSGNGAARAMAEARLKLESSVRDGALEVGNCDCKTRLLHRVGSGSYGDVYLGLKENDNTEVAVKVALSSCPSSSRSLLYEGEVYRKLAGCPGIANVTWFGMHGSDYSVLVMDLLGPTLYSVWTQLAQRLSMRSLLMIVDQTLETISQLHSRGFVHRDISPSNFMLGPSKDRIYLIDFGQAKRPVTKMVPASRHRFNFARPVAGTPRFASTFAHAGCEPAFRDDMESLGYLWIYLAGCRLPWQGVRDCVGQAKVERIGQLKGSTPVQELCAGLPPEFAAYLTYARSLRQHDFPDHAAARQMFRSLAEKLCPDDAEVPPAFDWMELDFDADDLATTAAAHDDPESGEEAIPTSVSPLSWLTD